MRLLSDRQLTRGAAGAGLAADPPAPLAGGPCGRRWLGWTGPAWRSASRSPGRSPPACWRTMDLRLRMRDEVSMSGVDPSSQPPASCKVAPRHAKGPDRWCCKADATRLMEQTRIVHCEACASKPARVRAPLHAEPRRRARARPWTARTASSTASCRGWTSTTACWRKPRTPAIRCWSGCASCRSAPPTSTSSIRSASPALIGQAKAGVTAGLRRRPHRGAAAGRNQAARRTRCWPTSSASWRELLDLLREAGVALCAHRRPVRRRQVLARRLVHGAGVPGADAAGDRSGASVPVHLQHGPGAGAAAGARGRRAARCAR